MLPGPTLSQLGDGKIFGWLVDMLAMRADESSQTPQVAQSPFLVRARTILYNDKSVKTDVDDYGQSENRGKGHNRGREVTMRRRG